MFRLNEAAAVLWGKARQGGVGLEGGSKERNIKSCAGVGYWVGGGRTEGSFGGQEGKAGGRLVENI
ncbi:hypothetical protein EYF80_024029 [Liparis tanakae]|uniref:Uncharacterized protein n=1 Tax=Liparis tanakae TaxID=230148 RepID=A0A4Z2HIV2_9TELE|nr:hypothetical protein EYF80_024029 [Liparis tanakae]